MQTTPEANEKKDKCDTLPSLNIRLDPPGNLQTYPTAIGAKKKMSAEQLECLSVLGLPDRGNYRKSLVSNVFSQMDAKNLYCLEGDLEVWATAAGMAKKNRWRQLRQDNVEKIWSLLIGCGRYARLRSWNMLYTKRRMPKRFGLFSPDVAQTQGSDLGTFCRQRGRRKDLTKRTSQRLGLFSPDTQDCLISERVAYKEDNVEKICPFLTGCGRYARL
ncbi:unnamed protein product [Toxocara canis]|uniref:Myosin motor domain-containing protein n=1 Tax=Toxocara canis TaxID=6265 RepID=A0A183UXK5_TOXCA|nr:unnamed protein product [Toxocara canis]